MNGRILIATMGLLGVLACTAAAGEPETVLLWPDGAPGARGQAPGDRPEMIIYQVESDRRTPALVILPGGGYRSLAEDHEGHEIAAWANRLGMTAAICLYRHRGRGNGGQGYGHPAPLQDAQRAIRLLRDQAKRWNIDPGRVGIIGFSAGGHLASTVSTRFDSGAPNAIDPVQRQASRPDFAVLCYAVIGFDKSYTHRGSQRNLLGANADPLLVQSLSSESQVSSQTPPTFLWHTSEDQAVPAENSVQYFLALQHQEVPAELHVFERGQHGVGLARGVPGTERWPELCVTWLRLRGVLGPAGANEDEPEASTAQAQ